MIEVLVNPGTFRGINVVPVFAFLPNGELLPYFKIYKDVRLKIIYKKCNKYMSFLFMLGLY